jgi:hypothetical protein
LEKYENIQKVMVIIIVLGVLWFMTDESWRYQPLLSQRYDTTTKNIKINEQR